MSHCGRIRSLTAAGDVEDKRSEMCGPSAPIPGPFWDRDVRSPASAQAPEVAQIELLGRHGLKPGRDPVSARLDHPSATYTWRHYSNNTPVIISVLLLSSYTDIVCMVIFHFPTLSLSSALNAMIILFLRWNGYALKTDFLSLRSFSAVHGHDISRADTSTDISDQKHGDAHLQARCTTACSAPPSQTRNVL